MKIGPTKAVEQCMSALVLVRRCRQTVGRIISATDLVIARRLSIAGRLRDILGHLEASRELHGEDAEAEIQRAENRVRELLVTEIQGEDIEPAFHLRRSFTAHDKVLGDYVAGLETALQGGRPTEPAMHADPSPRLSCRFFPFFTGLFRRIRRKRSVQPDGCLVPQRGVCRPGPVVGLDIGGPAPGEKIGYAHMDQDDMEILGRDARPLLDVLEKHFVCSWVLPGKGRK